MKKYDKTVSSWIQCRYCPNEATIPFINEHGLADIACEKCIKEKKLKEAK